MKITYFQMEQQLAKQLSPVYIISGDEILLKQDAIQLLRKAAKLNGISERIRLMPEAGYDWDQLYSLLNSTSLLAEKRLIEMDFRDITPPKAASKILEAYAANPSPDNLLVIDIGKIDDKISKSAWYKALDKIGSVVAIWPIPREQLPQWIINRAKKYKLQVNPDAANLLADYIEGNLVAAAQAIEKLYLLRPTHAIDSQFITAVLADESRFTVFDLIENIVGGDKSRTFHILNTLRDDGSEPVLILWAITRELRMLADMRQQLNQGQTVETLFQKYRIFAKRQAVVRRFLNRTNVESIWQQLAHAANVDRIIKGAAPGNSWEALQLYCLRILS